MDDVMMGGCTDRMDVYVCEDEYILSCFVGRELLLLLGGCDGVRGQIY